MSSIEEEDESELSDELVTQIERLPSIPLPQEYNQPASPSILEWDSEISESEQEFEDNNEHAKNNSEQLAANRALQNFIQSCSSSVSFMKNRSSTVSTRLIDQTVCVSVCKQSYFVKQLYLQDLLNYSSHNDDLFLSLSDLLLLYFHILNCLKISIAKEYIYLLA